MEKITNNQESVPKSFIKIRREHNLKALLDLLHENGIEIASIASTDPRLEAVELVSENYIPSLDSQLEVKASYDEIRSILENSEFNSDLDNIIGSI